MKIKRVLQVLAVAMVLTVAALGDAMAEEPVNEGVIYGGFSKHLGSSVDCNYEDGICRPFNEVNPSIGYYQDDLAIVVSKLSYDNWGVAAFTTIEFYESKYFDSGIRIGGVFGYQDTPVGSAVVPLVALVEEFKYKQHSIELGIMPTGDVTVLTLNFKYGF